MADRFRPIDRDTPHLFPPTVLAIAALALLAWVAGPLVFGVVRDYQRAVFAALTILVMGYPCAVGISAPLSIVCGAGEAADRGVLMRTGEVFQGLRRIDTMVFDKTRTLTEGQPAVRDIHSVDGNDDALLALAADVEATSLRASAGPRRGRGRPGTQPGLSRRG